MMSELESVRLSDSLEGIPDGCFDLCSLDGIKIPRSVKYMVINLLRIDMDELNEIPEGVEKIDMMLLKLCIMFLCHRPSLEIAQIFIMKECIDDLIILHTLSTSNNRCFTPKKEVCISKRQDSLADSKYNGPNKCCIRYQYDDKLPKEES